MLGVRIAAHDQERVMFESSGVPMIVSTAEYPEICKSKVVS
jgi:hypothetical protein